MKSGVMSCMIMICVFILISTSVGLSSEAESRPPELGLLQGAVGAKVEDVIRQNPGHDLVIVNSNDGETEYAGYHYEWMIESFAWYNGSVFVRRGMVYGIEATCAKDRLRGLVENINRLCGAPTSVAVYSHSWSLRDLHITVHEDPFNDCLYLGVTSQEYLNSVLEQVSKDMENKER